MTRPDGSRAGGDHRGNSYSRRARKLWMLSPAAGFGGDGSTVPCAWCAVELTFATVEADRIEPGGSYRRGNVRPACRACNLGRSDDTAWFPPGWSVVAAYVLAVLDHPEPVILA